MFALDATTGALKFVDSVHDGDSVGDPPELVSGLVGPEAVVVSLDDTTVYVAAETGDALLVFSRLEESWMRVGRPIDDPVRCRGDGERSTT